MLLKCSCQSDFQDKRYGKGQRVHNERKDPKAGPRCTVCGKEYIKVAPASK